MAEAVDATALAHKDPRHRQPTIFIWAPVGTEDQATISDIHKSLMAIDSTMPTIIINASNNQTGAYRHDVALTHISNIT